MRTLVNNLLDLTQLQIGRSNISIKNVDLLEAVERAVETLAQLNDKTVKVRVDPGRVMADPLRLDQALTNMLSNANRYGGDRIALWSRPGNDDTVMLDIADNGEGIPVDLRSHLFEPFKRGSTTAAIEGSGLGLAIAKALVEQFDGKVEFVGNDPGAHFRITLKKGADR
jgi:signal transduction histidine kinase